ncbi:MAG: cyclophane-containing peptide 2OG-Fe(II) oxygenase YhhC [Pyrinomonadaceae bacterium]
MILNKALDFSPLEISSEPFQYFVSTKALSDSLSLMVLDWFEKDAPWKLVETDFYEQYEFSFWDVQIPPHLTLLREQPFLDWLKTRVQSLFETELSTKIDVAAHRLIPGQRIRLHNDFIPGHETHRLLIQLNRGWRDENGGLLLFFNSSNPADIHRIFRPAHNSAVGFAVSLNSNHAVSTIHSGERFTLVYSFYGNSRNA